MPDLSNHVAVVVEDDPLNAMLIRRMLLGVGLGEVKVCKSGVETRQTIVHLSRVDLILLDIQLPEEDGFDILRSLRYLPSVDKARIVAVTANVIPSYIVRAAEAGFDGFLGKPLKFDEFRSQVLRILNGEKVWEP
ncbi:MAG TPA: response regulator [Anaerolineae bacterium]|nr:response regulator [Anaerolineae bacterium]